MSGRGDTGDDLDVVDRPVGPYRVSTDRRLVDVEVVHAYLSGTAYWARERPRDVVARSVANSALVVGAYTDDGVQVGFARMVTDLATFAWLCDVFVLEEHQGHGLGVALVETLVEHPAVVGVKRQILATADAHELYSRFGYELLGAPEKWMSREGPGR